jgi:hypothetical protein
MSVFVLLGPMVFAVTRVDTNLKVAKVGGLNFCLCPNCAQKIAGWSKEARLADRSK